MLSTYNQPDAHTVNKILESVDGWLYESEALELARLAGQAQSCIVEIGSYRGRSTIVMAKYANVTVYAVDPHIPSIGESTEFCADDRVAFTRNIDRFEVANKVAPINLTSAQASKVWNRGIGLLFIDGSHNYYSVRDDLANWIPYVLYTGVIAVHDCKGYPGVTQALSERNDLELIKQIDLTNFYRVRI